VVDFRLRGDDAVGGGKPCARGSGCCVRSGGRVAAYSGLRYSSALTTIPNWGARGVGIIP